MEKSAGFMDPNLATKMNDALMELQTKRGLVNEMKIECQTLRNSNMELNQQLDNLEHEKQFLQKKLNEIESISKQREEEWSSYRESWAQDSMKLEIANKTLDGYKTRIVDQQADINRLTVENEELKKITKKTDATKDANQIAKAKLGEIVQTVEKRLYGLQKVHNELATNSEIAIEIAKKTDEFRKNSRSLIDKCNADRERTEIENARLTMQLEMLTLPAKREEKSKSDYPPETFPLFNTKKFEAELAETFNLKFENIASQTNVYKNMEIIVNSEKEAREANKRLECLLKEAEEKLQHLENAPKKQVLDGECQTESDEKDEEEADDSIEAPSDQLTNENQSNMMLVPGVLSLILVATTMALPYDPNDPLLDTVLPKKDADFEAFYARQAYGVATGSSRPAHGHATFYQHRNPALVDTNNSPAYGFRFDGGRRFNFD